MTVHLQFTRNSLVAVMCVGLFSALTAFASTPKKSTAGSKTKIQGVILSRDGNLVKVLEKKSGSIRDIRITDRTEIRHDKKMGQKALIPGLRVKVVGMRNADGEVEAKKVSLNPNAFSIAVAMQQEIVDNQAATGRAQASADEGIAKAGAAQSSADQAQSTASQGVSTAQSATLMATANSAGISGLNQRVSDIGNFIVVASSKVHFSNGSARLSKSGKATLDELIAENSNVNGYLVAIEGYASSTGSEHYNQSLSDRRAAAVSQYLREKNNVPTWRFVTPAGYGETHPAASNKNSKGRSDNRRVEIKILVSKGVQNTAPTTATASKLP